MRNSNFFKLAKTSGLLMAGLSVAMVPAMGSSIIVGVLNGSPQAFSPANGAAEGVFNSTTGTRALATALNGDILEDDFSGGIVEYTPAGALVGTFANTGFTNYAFASAPDGTVYALGQPSSGNAEVLKYSSAGVLMGQAVPSYVAYQDIAVASNGDIVMESNFGPSVYSSAGTLIRTLSVPQLSFGVAVAPDGDIFASTAGSVYGDVGEVYVCRNCVNANGSFSQLGTFTTTDTLGKMLILNSTLYVTGRFGGEVLQFDTATGAESSFETGISGGPYSIALSSSNGPFGTSAAPEPSSLMLMSGAAVCGLMRYLRRARH